MIEGETGVLLRVQSRNVWTNILGGCIEPSPSEQRDVCSERREDQPVWPQYQIRFESPVAALATPVSDIRPHSDANRRSRTTVCFGLPADACQRSSGRLSWRTSSVRCVSTGCARLYGSDFRVDDAGSQSAAFMLRLRVPLAKVPHCPLQIRLVRFTDRAGVPELEDCVSNATPPILGWNSANRSAGTLIARGCRTARRVSAR